MDIYQLLNNYLNDDTSSSDESGDDAADGDADAIAADAVAADAGDVVAANEGAADALAEFNALEIVPRPFVQSDTLLYGDNMEMFGDVQSTMITIAGRLRHFEYHEADLIKILNPVGNIECIKCNFGCKPYAYGKRPLVEPASKRGRKKKEKTKRTRKIQGTGECFNSQLTFISRSSVRANKVYQFKIFRPGKIQLPGAKPSLYADIYDKLTDIINIINTDVKKKDEPKAELVIFAPSMKNYKFIIKKASVQLIDLHELRLILTEELLNGTVIDWANDRPDQFIQGAEDELKISYLSVDYTQQDTRLSVQFATPLVGRPDKCARVNIFMKGVVKVLGSLHDSVTIAIVRHLHNIFQENPQLLINEDVDETDADNIVDIICDSAMFASDMKLCYPSILDDIDITLDDELRFIDLLRQLP